MVILELVTGLNPSAHDPNNPGGLIYPVAQVIIPHKPGATTRCMENLDELAGWPKQLAADIARLALCCADVFDETRRPQFMEVVWSLRRMIKSFLPHDHDVKANVLEEPGPAPLREQSWQTPNRRSSPEGMPREQQNPESCLTSVTHDCSVSTGRTLAIRDMPGLAQLPQADAAPVFLELVAVARPLQKDLPLESRLIPLVPGPLEAGKTSVSAPVGRSCQQSLFKAWLSDPAQWRSISRRAFEVSWQPSLPMSTLRLHVCGGNHLIVDGAIVAPSSSAPLRSGSEVGLVGSDKVLLSFRCRPANGQGFPNTSAAVAKKCLDVSDTDEISLTKKSMSPLWGGKSVPLLGSVREAKILSAEEPEPMPREETILGSSDSGTRAEPEALHELAPSPDFAEEPEPQPQGKRRLSRIPAASALRRPAVGHHRALTQLLATQGLFALSKQLETTIAQAVGPKAGGCQVALELRGAGASVVPRALRRVGPVSLDARPMLVGWRHQPDLHQCVVLAGIQAFSSNDLFCIAKVRGELWLFAAAPLSLLQRTGAGGDAAAEEDEDDDFEGCCCTHLAPNEFTKLTAGDRIVLEGAGANSGRDTDRCVLYWQFMQVFGPTPVSAAKAA
jgi:hypothetical protein